jgi:RNA polymerase sigma-70 factor (ECF subfamily)
MADDRIDDAAASSATLLVRAQAGDAAARDALFRRYLPRLRRWAHGRLPLPARDLSDTDDLIQESLLRTLRSLDRFVPQFEGALQAYLREAIGNRIREELRRTRRLPARVAMASEIAARDPSPFESAVGAESLERYDRALQSLRPDEREAVIARLEMGMDYRSIAVELERPSAEAARKMVQRAIARMAEQMANAS